MTSSYPASADGGNGANGGSGDGGNDNGSGNGSGGQLQLQQMTATIAVRPPGSAIEPNTPDVISSIMTMTNPFQFNGNHGSPSSEDSSGPAFSPHRMQSICPSTLIKEELKLKLNTKRRNQATMFGGSGGSFDSVAGSPTAAASGYSAASSPGCGQAKRRRNTDEESHGDDDDDDDVSSYGEGVSTFERSRWRIFG